MTTGWLSTRRRRMAVVMQGAPMAVVTEGEIKPGRRERLGAGVLCSGLGVFLTYIVWSRQPGLQVPPAVGYLAAGAFLAAGATLLLQARGAQRAQQITAFLLVAALVGIGGWIGFGPGSRQCGGSLGFLQFVPGELVCRGVFGAGAVLTGMIAVLMLRPLLKGKGRGSMPEAANLGIARPPLVYLGAIALGVILHFARPIGLLPRGVSPLFGALVVLLAIALFLSAVRRFRAAGTPVPGNQPTTTIVRTGPYRFSRNPIYLAFSLLQLGIALWLNSLWLVVTLLPALAVMALVVIPKEERYLEARFPSDYSSYRTSVRRWL